MEKNIISMTMRYPKEIMEAMKQLAKKHHRSFNGEVLQALQEYIQRQATAEKSNDFTQGI